MSRPHKHLCRRIHTDNTRPPELLRQLLTAGTERASEVENAGWLNVDRQRALQQALGRMPLHKTWSIETDGSEHFFYCIDPSKFVEPDRFYDLLEATITDIRGLPPAAGFDQVRLPGELEWHRAQQWQQTGIPLHRDHVDKLKDLATAAKELKALLDMSKAMSAESTDLSNRQTECTNHISAKRVEISKLIMGIDRDLAWTIGTEYGLVSKEHRVPKA